MNTKTNAIISSQSEKAEGLPMLATSNLHRSGSSGTTTFITTHLDARPIPQVYAGIALKRCATVTQSSSFLGPVTKFLTFLVTVHIFLSFLCLDLLACKLQGSLTLWQCVFFLFFLPSHCETETYFLYYILLSLSTAGVALSRVRGVAAVRGFDRQLVK